MEKDFWAAPKRFWKTVRNLRRGKRGTIQAVYSKDGTLLTSSELVIGRWKEYFGHLLNPTQQPTEMETELEDDGVSSPISLGEVTVVVKQLHSGGWGRCQRSFKQVWWGNKGCVPIKKVSHYSACLGKSTPRCWKGGSGRLLNQRLKRNNVDSVTLWSPGMFCGRSCGSMG